jgi:MYND finger
MKLNPYPVIPAQGILQPWSIHRLNLEKLPILNRNATNIATWFNIHVGSTLSSRERSMRKKNKQDAIMYVKDTIHAMFIGAVGTQQKEQSKRYRLFCLRDERTNNSDTIFFINCIRFDLASHTLVCDAYVLSLTARFIESFSQPFGQLVHRSEMVNVPVYEGEMESWKQLLPALAERCRTTWTHGPNCEYKAKNKISLTEAMEENPLCSCGAGKGVEGMEKVELWKPFAPHVTRIALSPLFAVSYLETVGRSPETRKCARCRRKGNPHLKECGGCKQARYCSPACQKTDWKRHKPTCKGSSSTK